MSRGFTRTRVAFVVHQATSTTSQARTTCSSSSATASPSSAEDFQERVTAAAVRLGLLGENDLDEEEMLDLVELAADGRIVDARSGLGQYVIRHWERVALVRGRVARLLAAKARVPRRLARPPCQGRAARGDRGTRTPATSAMRSRGVAVPLLELAPAPVGTPCSFDAERRKHTPRCFPCSDGRHAGLQHVPRAERALRSPCGSRAQSGSAGSENPSRCSSSSPLIRISRIAPSGTISSAGSPSSG